MLVSCKLLSDIECLLKTFNLDLFLGDVWKDIFQTLLPTKSGMNNTKPFAITIINKLDKQGKVVITTSMACPSLCLLTTASTAPIHHLHGMSQLVPPHHHSHSGAIIISEIKNEFRQSLMLIPGRVNTNLFHIGQKQNKCKKDSRILTHHVINTSRH